MGWVFGALHYSSIAPDRSHLTEFLGRMRLSIRLHPLIGEVKWQRKSSV